MVMENTITHWKGEDRPCAAYRRSGPYPHLAFEPDEVRAAIVTCGGICPGLNDVVRKIVLTLHYNYGVDNIYGIRNGEFFEFFILTRFFV